MTGSVLHETSLVAKTVTAIRPHAMKMGLVFSVTALRILAIFVEPETNVAVWNGFVLKESHVAWETHLLGLGAQH